jgi:hypothetical protein
VKLPANLFDHDKAADPMESMAIAEKRKGIILL